MELWLQERVRAFFALTTAALLLATAFGVLNALPAKAAQTVPYKINFQGRLTDSSGNILTDGSYNIKFRIFNASSGGTNQWEEDRVYGASDNRVTVTNGLFNVQFGDLTVLSPSLFSGAYPLYLEVELPTPATATCASNGCASFTEGPMTPRQALASSPYAFNSDTLDGLDATQFGRTDAANTFTGNTQLFKNGSDSTNAFAVQNTSNVYLFAADTTNAKIGIGAAPTAGGATLQVTGTLSVSSTINGAAISGGTLSGGNVSGGTLTVAAVNSLNVGANAVSTASGSLTVDANGTGTVAIAGNSTGDILLGGGLGSTGCTVTNSTGAFACTSTINGATVTGGTLSAGSFTGGSVTGGSLTATAVNGLNVSSAAVAVAAAATDLAIDAGTSGKVKIGATSTGDIELAGGVGANGCTVTNSNGSLACSGTVNGATISGGTLSSGNVSGGTLTATAVNGLNVGSGAVSTASGSLTVDASGAGTVSIGGTSTGDVLLAGGSGAGNGCTVTNSNGNLACSGIVTANGSGLTNLDPSSLVQGSGAVTLQSAAAAALTITANAVSTWSTASGQQLTLQSGSGTLSLGNTTSITASGALTLDPASATALGLGTTNANVINVANSGTNAATLDIANNATAHTVHVADGNAANLTTIGSTNSGSTTTLQGGAGLVGVTNTGVGVGIAVATRALHLAVNTSAVNAPPLLIAQSGAGDSGIELKNSGATSSFFLGNDASDSNSFKINSYAAATTTLPSTITHVQSTSNVGAPVTTTLAKAFTSNNTAGNTIIAAIGWDTSNTTAVTCSDNNGNSYSTALIRTDATNNDALAVCYATNIHVGANTVTATFGGTGASGRTLAIHEYSGITVTSPTDNPSSNVVNGTTGTDAITSLAATTTQNGDLIFGAVLDTASTTTISAGTGFSPHIASGSNFLTEDKTQALAGSVAATFTFTSAHRYLAWMVPFKAVTGGGSLTDTNANALFSLGQTGAAKFQGTTNSTTAFLLNTSNAVTVLDADTANGRIGIGNAAPTTTLDVTGSVNSSGGAVTLQGNAASSLTTSAGALTITSNQAATWSTTNGLLTLQGAAGATVSAGGSAQSISLTPSTTGSVVIGGTAPFITTSGATALRLDAGGAAALSLGDTNANVINMANSGTNAATLNIANNATAHTVHLADGNAANAITIGSTNAGASSLVQGGATKETISNTGATIQTTTNSTTAFQVQNAGSASLISLDTTGTNTNNLVTNASFESALAGNWALKGSATVSQDATQNPPYGTKSAKVITAATDDGIKQNVTLTDLALYSVSFYARLDSASAAMTTLTAGYNNGTSDSNCTINSGTPTANGWTKFTCSMLTAVSHSGTPFFYIKDTASGHTFYVDAVTLETEANGSGNYREGKLSVNATIVTPLILQNQSNSSTALQLQNSDGANIFTIDSTDTNLVANSSFEVNSASWAKKGSAIIIRDTSQAMYGQASLLVISSATANDGVQQTLTSSLGVGNTYTLSFSVKLVSGTFATLTAGYTNTGGDQACVLTPTPSATNPTTGWNRFTCSFTVATTAATGIFIKQTDAASHSFWLDSVELDSGSTATPYGLGALSLNGVINSPVTLQNKTDSTMAFKIQNAGAINTLLSVDTLNSVVNVGSGATADATQILLNLDSFSTFADTATCSGTTNQGALYYNTNTNAIRGCVNGGWEDVVTSADLGIIAFGIVLDSNTTAAGDVQSLVGGSGVPSGPCQPYWKSATAVAWTGCTAYSGGRRVVIPANSTGLTTTNTIAGQFQHLCLTAAGNQPAFSVAGTETANLPTWSANSPILCLADVKFAGANNTITNLYDTRVFTNTSKQYVYTNAAMGLDYIAVPSTNKVTATAVAATPLEGVIVATNGIAWAAGANGANAIMITGGEGFVKTTAALTIANLVETTTTTGYATAVVNPGVQAFTDTGVSTGSVTVVAPYTFLGLAQTTSAAASACSATVFTCGSALVNIEVR